MALTKVTNRMTSGAFVNVLDFGASSSASATANLAAFNAAVAATPTNGTLYVPVDASEYVIDTSGGRSGCILVNKEMTLVIDGIISGSTATIEANPQTIFNVSADNVTFTGNGVLKGDGTVNQENTGTDATFPTLVYVTGDYFTITEMTIDTPPKVGLHIAGGNNAKITNCNFTGGPSVFEDTAYFAIRFYQGGQHIVSNNQFYPDASGGMFVSCILSNDAHNCIYDSNIVHKPYEKFCYIVSDGNIISNNTVIGNPDFIAGTNVKGTLTTVYRCDGANNKITGNYSRYGGGVSCRYDGGNVISDNTFLDVGQSGCSITFNTSVFDYTAVKNNVIVAGDLKGYSQQDGILIGADIGTNYQIDVSNNTIQGYGLSTTDRFNFFQTWQAAQTTTDSGLWTVIPTVVNNFYYVAQNAGTTGGSEPSWPTTAGATVVDGTVTWEAFAYGSTSVGGIRVIAPATTNSDCTIANNNISGGDIGIYTTYMNESVIQNNIISATNYGIIQNNGTANAYRFNRVLDASVNAIGSLDADSSGFGNTYQNSNIAATITLTAGVATMNVPTTTLLAATSGSKGLISPFNDAAADFIRDHGLYVSFSGSTVVIISASGTNFVGTEQVNIQLIQ